MAGGSSTSPAPVSPPASARAPASGLRSRVVLLAFIGVGGALGTAARYGTALAIPPRSDVYPVATFLVNIVGAVILGAVATLPKGSLPAHDLTKAAIGTGFCGGLTTFSTMSLEIYQPWPGHPQVALVYAVTSLVAAPLCAIAGGALVQAGRKRLSSRSGQAGQVGQAGQAGQVGQVGQAGRHRGAGDRP